MQFDMIINFLYEYGLYLFVCFNMFIIEVYIALDYSIIWSHRVVKVCVSVMYNACV